MATRLNARLQAVLDARGALRDLEAKTAAAEATARRLLERRDRVDRLDGTDLEALRQAAATIAEDEAIRPALAARLTLAEHDHDALRADHAAELLTLRPLPERNTN